MRQSKSTRWYWYGFVGAPAVAAATLIDFLFATPRLLLVEGLSYNEVLMGLLKAVALSSALGFGGGTIIGLMVPLSQRVGVRGSVVIGALGAPATSLFCILVFAPALCQMEYLSRGILLCLTTGLLGGVLGATLAGGVVDGDTRKDERT